jgi:hypothetical protein
LYSLVYLGVQEEESSASDDEIVEAHAQTRMDNLKLHVCVRVNFECANFQYSSGYVPEGQRVESQGGLFVSLRTC